MAPPSHELIETLAPDQSSLNAAKKLLSPKKWPLLESDDAFLWGHCQGSGSTPYQVVYCVADRGYKCSCPSRKFPCKHVLALMWLRADQVDLFASGDAPPWIAEWMGRRRPQQAANAADGEDNRGAAASTKSLGLAAASQETKKPKDPAAAERARVRNARKREAAIADGLDELDTWLTDQLEQGVIGFSSRSISACDTISRRLYDAKAPALGVRLAALAQGVHGWPEPDRPERLIAEFGELHLIAEAYRRQADLSPELRADVRRAIGWTTTREELLADASAERASGQWIVGCTRSEVQVDRIKRQETWLVGLSEGNLDRRAVLVDYAPASAGASASPYRVGDVLAGELTYYPSAAPMRAQLSGDQGGVSSTAPDRSGLGLSLASALASIDEERARLPWLETTSIWAHDLQVSFDQAGRAWVHDGSGERALPIVAPDVEEILPLAGLAPLTGHLLWDGYGATLGLALTEMGAWRPA